MAATIAPVAFVENILVPMCSVHHGLEQLDVRQLIPLVPRPFGTAQHAQAQPLSTIEVDDLTHNFVQRVDGEVGISEI